MSWRHWNYSYWWTNIKRIFDYIPILWSDFDFNADTGLYKLMRKKLERVEPCLRYGHLVNGERYARQIRVALAVLDRIIADKYDDEETDPHFKKWGDPEWTFTPIEDGRGMSELHINHKNAHTDAEKEQERKEFLAHMHRAAERRQRDIDWVFSHIRRWHTHWWD